MATGDLNASHTELSSDEQDIVDNLEFLMVMDILQEEANWRALEVLDESLEEEKAPTKGDGGRDEKDQ
jgi:hypothetical protein